MKCFILLSVLVAVLADGQHQGRRSVVRRRPVSRGNRQLDFNQVNAATPVAGNYGAPSETNERILADGEKEASWSQYQRFLFLQTSLPTATTTCRLRPALRFKVRE